MFVRIARFEGVEGGRIDEQLEEFMRALEQVRPGEMPAGAPAESFETLSQDVTRVLELADRSNGVVVDPVFADTEEAIKRMAECGTMKEAPREFATSAVTPLTRGLRRTEKSSETAR